jgi:hypothetical protein
MNISKSLRLLGIAMVAVAINIQAQTFIVDMNANVAGVQSTLTAAPGDSVVVDLLLDLSGAPNGVSSYGVSIRYDRSELTLVSTTELLPAGFSFNLSSGVSGVTPIWSATRGQVETFEAGGFGSGPTSGVLSIGTIRFTASAVASDGEADVFVGLFNAGFDGVFDNSSGDIGASTGFSSGSLLLVPEPEEAAAAVALGLVLVALMCRRRTA